jgi:hypothetical protein
VDSGSTNTFLYYTFASKINCDIVSTASRRFKVAGGGHLDSCAITKSTSYFIQNEAFSADFKLL